MPEDNEKVEDFISLWRKKMEGEIKSPNAISEALDKIKEVEDENEDLRNKIKENVELITKTEEIIKKTIEENKKLKEQLEKGTEKQASGNQQENIVLTSKLKVLEKNLAEKDINLKTKEDEITELKIKLETLTMTSKPAEKDSEDTTALINNLQTELSKKNSQIDDQEKKINELIKENETLNQQIIEAMKKQPVDYVVPVEEPKPSITTPPSTQSSSETLELLCQDLQSDLNKYKKIVDKLNNEKSELEKTIKSRGFQLQPDELKDLKRENEELKKELTEIQISLQNKAKDTAQANQIKEAEEQINKLQEQLEEKEQLILELENKQQTQPAIKEKPMTELIEDLQNTINKLKMTIEEKNNIIEKLKSS